MSPRELENLAPEAEAEAGEAEAEAGAEAPGAAVMQRRHFLRVAAAAAAAGGSLGAGTVLAQEPPTGRGGGAGGRGGGAGPAGAGAQQAQQAPAIPLGNGEHPALVFQAYPGGTGALMEKLIRERGAAAFERRPIEIALWQGPVPISEEDLAFLPAHRLGALLRERRISSVEITEIYLERLKRHNPTLLAAVTILEGRAREEAQQADAELRAGQWRGPLHGVPYGIKDLFAIRGTPTTWGSADFEDQVLDYDSEIAVRLRDAGAVLIAKLATGQFASGANWFRGRTNNPWNPELSSSGSSAGPGSATAGGLVGFSIGTETQGSITSPSRANGLSALRPTFGRISRHGGMVLAWSMDKPGPMCRTIEDCALVFHAIHGADPKDPATLTTPFHFERDPDLSRLRIGFDSSAPEEFVASLRELGADPRPMPDLPPNITSGLGVESAAAFDFYVADQVRAAEDAGEEPTGRFMGGGRRTTALDYIQAQRRRLILMHRMADVMEDFDLFVSNQGAVALLNQTGHPTVVVPYMFGTQGNQTHEQPRCTMLIGQLFADDVLLSVAHKYQVTKDWHTHRPKLG